MKANWEYNQATDASKWNAAHQNGVCMALAANWIIETASDRSFQTWVNSSHSVNDCKGLYDQHRRLRDEDELRIQVLNNPHASKMGRHRATAHPGYLSRMMELIRLHITSRSPLHGGTSVRFENQPARNIASALLISTGFKFVNWRVSSLASQKHAHASHAVAAKVDPEKVVFFDPNSGEIETTDGREEFVKYFEFCCKGYGFELIEITTIIEF